MTAVAITRIAIRSPLGNSLEETVAALRIGSVGIGKPSALEQTPKVEAGAGEVPLSAADRGAWRAEVLLRRTIEDVISDDDRASIAKHPTRWAIVLGTTLAGMRHCGVGMRADEVAAHEEADAAFARTCASSVLAHAVRDCGIAGPTLTVSCACASALSAVNHACSLLEAGVVDAAIAGGYDPISEFVYGGFSALQLVAGGPLSPFAHDREGMKLGEGAALLLLRRVEDVAPNGTESIRGIIVGTGESSDAHHLTQPHPDGSGAARALRMALMDANGALSLPELLVAHGTGTPGNDGAEYQAYRGVFGDDLQRVPVVALKSRFGHPLGAAGVLEVASAIGCAEARFIPTTAGTGCDTEAFPDLNLIEGASRDGSPSMIAVLSAGFGGANAATCILRGRTGDRRRSAPRQPIVTISITAAGAVTPAGRGARALVDRMSDPSPWPPFSEDTLVPLLDRGRTRRLALLPRLMIAAIRDLAEASGLTADELARTPLLAANWCGAADFTERFYRDLVRSGIDLANPVLFAESVPNIGSAQCSLAFGVTAPSLSVIGRRTAGLEALLLAQARLTTGEWNSVIIVAAEEEHPIVARTLSRCASREVPLRSGAVAFLVERERDARIRGRRPIFTLENVYGQTAPLSPERSARRLLLGTDHALQEVPATTSDTPFDDAVALQRPDCSRIAVPEFGAATPYATMLADGGDGRRLTVGSDPHGACWAAVLR